MHIKIDPVGGIAGDMFVAAMIDLFPHLETGMLENLRCVSALSDVAVKLISSDDAVLVGKRFKVTGPILDHQHTRYTELLDNIRSSSMTNEVKDRAVDIIRRLALAEARVHGVELDSVSLHEAGSPDSLADIVCSAYLISAAQIQSWSCGALPTGNGFVKTAHGDLPVPAPAVLELLQGFPLHNDGREGERVTPTGAAILCALEPRFDTRQRAMALSGVGHGFGTATLCGISNVLRLTVYEDFSASTPYERVGLITFEVDDQSPEDLSVGLERLRADNGVLDVIQIPAIGKKGRLAAHIQVLTKLELADEVAQKCATETATLGVRIQNMDRVVLEREMLVHDQADTALPVKLAKRPDGTRTAKVEADHLAKAGGFSQRKVLKQAVEMQIEQDSNKFNN